MVTIYSSAIHLGDALSVQLSNENLKSFVEMGRHLKRGGERDHKSGSVYLGRSISVQDFGGSKQL